MEACSCHVCDERHLYPHQRHAVVHDLTFLKHSFDEWCSHFDSNSTVNRQSSRVVSHAFAAACSAKYFTVELPDEPVQLFLMSHILRQHHLGDRLSLPVPNILWVFAMLVCCCLCFQQSGKCFVAMRWADPPHTSGCILASLSTVTVASICSSTSGSL